MIYEEVLQAEKKFDDCINWETGEISEDYESAREELQSVLECGIETLCKIRANKQARIESLKAEINRLTERKKQEEKRIESLEKFIKSLFDKTGKEKLDAGTFSLSYRKSTQVKVDDNFYNKDYMRVKEEVDKAKIKADLLAGAEIAGAYLVENKNLQVK
jgi:hypothetical protein